MNLKHAEFDDAEFIDCDFGLAKLDFVNARNSQFRGDDVYSTGARLVSADFSGSIIDGAGFSGIDAYGAKFFCADLRGANFAGADLRGVLTLLTHNSMVLSSTEPSWMAGP